MKKKILLILVLLTVEIVSSQCFTSVSGGYVNTVGLKHNGTIWGWGFGDWGQLNNGTGIDEYSPVLISNTTDWQFVKNYYYNTFAIKNNGTLWACGYNLYGELGIGSSSNSPNLLTQVGTTSNWKVVVSSRSQTIAMKTDNTLWGWGQNDFYQVGNGSCCGNVLSPVLVSSSTDWRTIAVSSIRSSFALKTNGTLWGWGHNINNLLGESTISVRQTPAQLNADTDWSAISVGDHILALKNNNTLWAWGSSENGEAGHNPANSYDPSLPNQIPGTNWNKIATGFRFSLAIKTDGTLWAWGKNDAGQLADGTTTDRYIPVQVGSDTNWNTVSAGRNHVVATKSDGSLWTWGDNEVGQLGNGTTVANTTPTLLPIDGCVLSNETFTPAQPVLTVSPNPAQNEFQIAYKGVSVVNSIVIYDLSGRVVYTTNPMASSTFSAILNISELQSGSYVVVLKNGEKKVVSKQLIKE
jgi:alpha-tubulin suppressor-like RCC1 family protein